MEKIMMHVISNCIKYLQYVINCYIPKWFSISVVNQEGPCLGCLGGERRGEGKDRVCIRAPKDVALVEVTVEDHREREAQAVLVTAAHGEHLQANMKIQIR